MLLVGEAGIGKTALLNYAAERAPPLRALRARGIESERNVPFAALLELLRPALPLLGQLPPPQAAGSGQAPDPTGSTGTCQDS